MKAGTISTVPEAYRPVQIACKRIPALTFGCLVLFFNLE
jgi:hypothetical protein